MVNKKHENVTQLYIHSHDLADNLLAQCPDDDPHIVIGAAVAMIQCAAMQFTPQGQLQVAEAMLVLGDAMVERAKRAERAEKQNG